VSPWHIAVYTPSLFPRSQYILNLFPPPLVPSLRLLIIILINQPLSTIPAARKVSFQKLTPSSTSCPFLTVTLLLYLTSPDASLTCSLYPDISLSNALWANITSPFLYCTYPIPSVFTPYSSYFLALYSSLNSPRPRLMRFRYVF
jgi:hypothetical protein